MGRARQLPSPALLISVLALVVAAGGGSYALARHSGRRRRIVKISRRVANRRIRRLAPRLSVSHADSAATATRADHAGSADTATRADSATEANHAASAVHAASADTANSAGVANQAYTAYHDGELKIHAETYGTVGTLHIPQPGTYVILAKLFVNNHEGGIEYADGDCRLVAPGAVDQTDFSVGSSFYNVTEAISLQVNPVLTAAADVLVRCEYNSHPTTTNADINVDWQKITAIQVAGRTTTGF